MWVQRKRREVAAKGARKAAVSLAVSAFLALFCASSATAMRIEFGDDPLLSDTSKVSLLTHGAGNQFVYEFLDITDEPTNSDSRGDVFTIEARVSFFEAADYTAEYMLAFTSIRDVGPATQITCAELAPGGAFGWADFDYVHGSFKGAVTRDTTPTDSRVDGESTICNAEDGRGGGFFGLVFAPDSSAPLNFSFQIVQLKNGAADSQVVFLKKGFSAIPEPGTAVLLIAGLGGIAISRRAGARRR
jgi:hypothetical protein